MTSVFKKLIPTFNRVVIKKVVAETKSKAGIILQDTSSPVSYGEVISTGPGNLDTQGKTVPLAVKVGDIVLLPDYGGSKITLKDGDFFVYRDTDIVGTLHKD